ncbi:hypothetical protein N579_00460 [Corynebacterium pseudodiphtheriticum 090104]|nr:hypothetical protein N579_00460 [Corynebacterium pseudodiphtheriticum 090104]
MDNLDLFFQRRYYATSAHLRCRESTGAGEHRLLREFRVLAEGYYGKDHPRLWPYLRDVISIAAPAQASAITSYAASLGLPPHNNAESQQHSRQ